MNSLIMSICVCPHWPEIAWAQHCNLLQTKTNKLSHHCCFPFLYLCSIFMWLNVTEVQCLLYFISAYGKTSHTDWHRKSPGNPRCTYVQPVVVHTCDPLKQNPRPPAALLDLYRCQQDTVVCVGRLKWTWQYKCRRQEWGNTLQNIFLNKDEIISV